MATTATVSSKGQITLPKRLRDKHHLEEGELVLVLETKDGVLYLTEIARANSPILHSGGGWDLSIRGR